MDFSGAIPIDSDPMIDNGRPFLTDLVSELPGKKRKLGTSSSFSATDTDDNGKSMVLSPMYQRSGDSELELKSEIPGAIVECMATCHNVALYGESQFVGMAFV